MKKFYVTASLPQNHLGINLIGADLPASQYSAERIAIFRDQCSAEVQKSVFSAVQKICGNRILEFSDLSEQLKSRISKAASSILLFGNFYGAAPVFWQLAFLPTVKIRLLPKQNSRVHGTRLLFTSGFPEFCFPTTLSSFYFLPEFAQRSDRL